MLFAGRTQLLRRAPLRKAATNRVARNGNTSATNVQPAALRHSTAAQRKHSATRPARPKERFVGRSCALAPLSVFGRSCSNAQALAAPASQTPMQALAAPPAAAAAAEAQALRVAFVGCVHGEVRRRRAAALCSFAPPHSAHLPLRCLIALCARFGCCLCGRVPRHGPDLPHRARWSPVPLRRVPSRALRAASSAARLAVRRSLCRRVCMAWRGGRGRACALCGGVCRF